MANADRSLRDEPETGVVGSGSELATRMDAVVRLFETKTLAAKAAGITPEQLSRQLKALNRPFFDTMARLCIAKGVSLDWIATGEGAMLQRDRSSLSSDTSGSTGEILLNNLVQGLEIYLRHKDLKPQPAQKARMIVIFYRILSRWREQLIESGSELPMHLRAVDHPVDIAAHPILSEVVGLID
ncbi:DNA-binding phage protein [Azospirillum agricola]|uniref:hypothetical protein n=1 Tax=Azospirillum agricola TaxID=1720247 RepID=UPI001AE22079|nr:hypothetical protein [Azospirillum agricola]MBP2231809.1 DNA-binding phage protein [Azospirillum agricola]